MHLPINHNRLKLIAFLLVGLIACTPEKKPLDAWVIKKTTAFNLYGTGDAPEWKAADWIQLNLLPAYSSAYTTKAKLLYSSEGIYGLFVCTDSLLTNTIQEDRKALYNEDVIEIFLQPDTSKTHYFEYELSPLNYETPLLIFNKEGDLNSWHPFEIQDKRKIIHATSVSGGSKTPGATASGWSCEFFIPFNLLKPIASEAPVSGTIWRGNLYRIDYDKGETLFTWKPNSGSFHEYQHFGYLEFE